MTHWQAIVTHNSGHLTRDRQVKCPMKTLGWPPLTRLQTWFSLRRITPLKSVFSNWQSLRKKSLARTSFGILGQIQHEGLAILACKVVKPKSHLLKFATALSQRSTPKLISWTKQTTRKESCLPRSSSSPQKLKEMHHCPLSRARMQSSQDSLVKRRWVQPRLQWFAITVVRV